MSGLMKFAKFALGNLISKPATSNYPQVQPEYTERTRGKVMIDIDECLFCGLCAKRCVADAITVDRKTKTWTIERMGCVQCANCVESCPKQCLHMDRHYPEPDAHKYTESYVQTQKDEEASAGSGIARADLDKCVYCTLCAKNCPQGAITVDRKEKTWSIDEEACVSCGLCAEKCPKKCISLEEPGMEQIPAKTEEKPVIKAAETKEKSEEEAVSENVSKAQNEELENVAQADLDKCVYCTLCAKNCPQGAITVNRQEKTWEINKEECIGCGLCADKCPKKCITIE